MSGLWCEGIVPFRQEFVKDCGVQNKIFDVFCGVATDFVNSPDNVDRRCQTGVCGCVSHQFDGGIQSVEQQTRAGAADMRKESPFDWIVIRTVTRIVGHADFHADVEMSSIAMQIKNSVWNQDAIGPAWKIVIERAKRSAASCSSVAKQTTDEFFGLCVHGKTRVASTFVLFPELCDSAELLVTIR